MSMAKDANFPNSLPPRRRRTSFSGFFSRILPSHRAEQGGTTRSHDITDNSESAYIDLGMNPNDLTEWNLAQERRVEPLATEASTGSQNHRDHSWSIQRGRPRLRDDLAQPPQASQRAPSLDLIQPPNPPEPPGADISSQARHRKSRPITRDEIHNTLKAKEDTRRHRLSLKESGDWLGVQGADPYSGEFAVLTPTSTMSSETTPPSAKKRLAELSRRQTTAKIAYEQAKLEEEAEKEKVLLQKGQSRLEKMDHVKEELRRQQLDIPTWSQHKRRWSSAAEPDLSPIPQSIKSAKLESSSNEATNGSVRNFSRPSKSNGSLVMDEPKLVGLSANYENTEPSKHDHRKNRSTDTIIHKALPNIKFPGMSLKGTKVVYPSVLSDADDSPVREQNGEKHFLWRRRRRMSDPGKLRKRPNFLMINASAGRTQESLVSDSIEPPPPIPRLQLSQELKNHFPDLCIPDSHLHLVPYSERMVRMEKPLTTTNRDLSPVVPAGPTQGSYSEAQSKAALRIVTNLSACQGLQTGQPQAVSDTKGATATSFQSSSKGNTKYPPIYQRLMPTRTSSFQAKLTQAQASQVQIQNTSETRNHTGTNLPRTTGGSQSLCQGPTSQESTKTGTLDADIGINMSEHYETGQEGSVSTPTIIITGFGPDRQLLFEGTQQRLEPWKDEEGSAVGSGVPPVILSSHREEQASCIVSTSEKEWSMTMSSRPTTPQSDLQSFVLARETLETDTTSTDLAMSGVDPEFPVQHFPAYDSHQAPQNVLMKRVSGKVEEVVAVSPLRHHEANQEQPTQAKEIKSNITSLPYRRRGNRVQVAHQRQAPKEHKETMIQEAAQIAMWRSRAKEVVTTRNHTPSRTPSPRMRGTRETSPAVPSRRSVRMPQGSGSGRGDADFPSFKIGFKDLQPPPQSEPQEPRHRNPGQVKEQTATGRQFGEEILEILGDTENGVSNENTEDGVAVMLASLFITVCMVLLGLAWAWWVMVKPAFDQRSELWRRRRSRESMWGDITVFAAAAAFCAAGALLLAVGIRTGFWVIVQILQL